MHQPLPDLGLAQGWAPKGSGGQDRAAGGGQVRGETQVTPPRQLQTGLPTSLLADLARQLGAAPRARAQASCNPGGAAGVQGRHPGARGAALEHLAWGRASGPPRLAQMKGPAGSWTFPSEA